MRFWAISEFGIDKLQMREAEPPALRAGEALIEVHACSLNYRDLMTVTGQYNPRMPLPRVPLSDGAGVVLAVGAGVTRVKPGDRVAAIFMQNWISGPPTADRYKGALGGDIDGMATEFIVLPAEGLVLLPETLSFAEAAALPCAYVTAWSALTKAVGLGEAARAGRSVLIQGTGGVSIAALQLAKAMGMRVLGTSSSDDKLERAGALGLDAGVNYREQPDWAEWTRQQTGGNGADLVIEVGGAGTLAQSLTAAAIGGAVAQIGVLSQAGQAPDVRAILIRQLRVQGIYVGCRDDFEALLRFMAQHAILPVIDERIPFEELPKALLSMQQGSHFGKLVITLR